MNADLESEHFDLTSILSTTLDRDDGLDFEALKEKLVIPTFQPGWLDEPVATPNRDAYALPPITLTQKLMPGGKAAHERECLAAETRYAAAYQHWHQSETNRLAQLTEYRQVYDDAIGVERAALSRSIRQLKVSTPPFELATRTPCSTT